MLSFLFKNVNYVAVGKYLRTFWSKFDNAGTVLKAVGKFSSHQWRRKKAFLMLKLLAFEHTTLPVKGSRKVYAWNWVSARPWDYLLVMIEIWRQFVKLFFLCGHLGPSIGENVVGISLIQLIYNTHGEKVPL